MALACCLFELFYFIFCIFLLEIRWTQGLTLGKLIFFSLTTLFLVFRLSRIARIEFANLLFGFEIPTVVFKGGNYLSNEKINDQ
jgi:hypothetical protein